MKKRILLIIINALLLAAFFVCLAFSGSIRGTLRSQQAAAVWAGQSGERFAQISVFLPSGSSFDENSIHSLRESINRALTDASLEAPEGGRLYADAWSAVGEAFVTGGRGSISAQAYGVGGDFFLFHPLILRDGSYISPIDLMRDRVVLDEELAWRIFGSSRLAGLEVMIRDTPYNRLHFIAGVVSREDDFASSKAYTGGAGMFMSYESLNLLSGGGAEIVCYEIVMPDPITGFALQTVTDAFPVSDAVIVENSSRYSLTSLFDVISSFGERSMKADGMVYPYWENAARYTEDWLALLLLLSYALIAYPAVCGVVYGIKGIRFLLKNSRRAVRKKADDRAERAAEKYRQTHIEDYVIPDIEEIIREVQEERGSGEEPER